MLSSSKGDEPEERTVQLKPGDVVVNATTGKGSRVVRIVRLAVLESAVKPEGCKEYQQGLSICADDIEADIAKGNLYLA